MPDSLPPILESASAVTSARRQDAASRKRRDVVGISLVVAGYLILALSDWVGRVLPFLEPLNGESEYVDELFLGVAVAATVGIYWARRRGAEMRNLARQLADTRSLAEAGFTMNPFPVFVVDRDTLRLLAVNDAVLRDYGYTRDELRSMTALDIGPADRRGTSVQKLGEIHDGDRFTVHGEHQRKDGSRFWVESAHTATTFSGHRALISVAKDISATRAAEAATRESELRYRAIFDTEAVGIVEVDARTGNIISVNDTYARIVARDRSELVGMNVLQLTHPDDLAASSTLLETLRSHSRPTYATMKRFLRPDGTYRWVALAAAHVEHGTQEAAHVEHGTHEPARNIAVVVDITDQVLAEQEAERLGERLSLTLDVLGEGTFDWDLSTDAWLASPALNRMLGYHPDELPNQVSSWRTRLHPGDAARFEAALAAHLAGDVPDFELEHRLRRRDARFVWVEARGQVVKRADDGRPLRMVGSITNITERRELEEQLRQSQKMEAIGQLAGGIAHDFNNLLTVIRTGLELALSENLSEETRADLNEVEIATDRAANLTTQLLAFSRRRLAQPRLMSLNDAVDELSKLLTRVLTEDIDVRRRLQARTFVMADPGHVGQALLNIAVNARDAMPDGGVLTLNTFDALVEAGSPEAHDGVAPGRYSVICVGDSGHGMTPEVRARIFEPFFTTKPLGKGTGLGLASVYGVVKQADGFARVESAPNAGSRFYLYFPVAAAQAPSDETATAEELPGGNETVLVVEDDGPVRSVAARLLSAHGYHVLQAGDGAAGLALLDRQPRVDLVLTDIVMPNMSGGALTAEGSKRHPNTAFVVMSAHAPETLAQYQVPSEVALLPKPFTTTALLLAVRKAIDAKRLPLG